ncbi:hypothetical protein H6G81_05260 [Scytonema hofmannii FACHB-248]|uniref:Uncharacterized protein n=1 Tax=Scytonema hofmannii FACHB-248 TaxID=1842502 RepID=A0ABR8GLN8_9CYAN|nr:MULTISPECIES: hypothetical protein [Nostocales]MBD2603954.1 hypothetical protein [Scytonema hofmannii FACHB-248]
MELTTTNALETSVQLPVVLGTLAFNVLIILYWMPMGIGNLAALKKE